MDQRRPPVVHMIHYSDVTRSLNPRLNLKEICIKYSVNVATTTIDKNNTILSVVQIPS